MAEALFWWRDEGAFPHVNFYVPDAELGVRLRPGASQRLKFRDNPRTTLRVNASGYRGADFPPPAEGEILVVGDSQVFGLGVEEEETFAAQLARVTQRQVLNLGVPTYGPQEYTKVVQEVLAERRPSVVVYTINLVNDLFESERPNKDRHAVWDGWAVRVETAPERVTWFPGRELLMSRSHLVFALRKWLHGRGPKLDDQGFFSEGTWHDLVELGSEVGSKHEQTEREAKERAQARADELQRVRGEIGALDGAIESLMFEVFPELYGGYGDQALRLKAARGSPGDIVQDEGVEEGRAVALTAEIIRRGVRYRDELAARIAGGQRPSMRDKLRQALVERQSAAERRAQLHSTAIVLGNVPSVVEPRLAEIKALCDQHGIELVVLGLPIDVQVSPKEWKKYGVADPPDMSRTRALLEDLVASAEGMGARGLDATAILEAVQEPAFLDHDIHMTPAGHRAVAAALAQKLVEPPPLRRPDAGLPEGRTRVPDPEMWRTTPEILVKGSSKAHCETLRLGEWLRVTCLRKPGHVPSGIQLESGGRGEAMVVVTEEAMTLLAPLFRGESFAAVFTWESHAQRLVGEWQEAREPPTLVFEERTTPGTPLAVSAEAQKLCECHKEVAQEKVCRVEHDWPTDDCRKTCVNLYGAPAPECFTAYGDDCARLLACVRGDPSAMPPCGLGLTNAGGTGHCFRLCAPDRPCPQGECQPWQGAHICR